jgi:hypothetical protein
MKDALGSNHKGLLYLIAAQTSPAPASRTPGLAAIKNNTPCDQSLSRLSRSLLCARLYRPPRPAGHAVLVPAAPASFTPAPSLAPVVFD